MPPSDWVSGKLSCCSYRLGAWILYSRGRVWLQQLSSAEGHRWFFLLQWSTQFLIVCLCMQMSGGKKATTADHRFGGGPELNLRWWTQALSRLNKKHRGSKKVWGWELPLAVADPGFPRRGPTPEFGMKIYYLTTFLAKTVWKWKTLDRGGGGVSSAPWLHQWFGKS